MMQNPEATHIYTHAQRDTTTTIKTPCVPHITDKGTVHISNKRSAI